MEPSRLNTFALLKRRRNMNFSILLQNFFPKAPPKIFQPNNKWKNSCCFINSMVLLDQSNSISTGNWKKSTRKHFKIIFVYFSPSKKIRPRKIQGFLNHNTGHALVHKESPLDQYLTTIWASKNEAGRWLFWSNFHIFNVIDVNNSAAKRKIRNVSALSGSIFQSRIFLTKNQHRTFFQKKNQEASKLHDFQKCYAKLKPRR